MSKTGFLASAAVAALVSLPANAGGIDVPAGGLKDALSAYTAQTGVHVFYAESLVKGAQSRGFKGNLPADQALSRILAGTGLMPHQDAGVVEIIRGNQSSEAAQAENTSVQLAQLSPRNTSVETVTVTSSKLGGADVQSVPIAISAFSQEQLTATQTAGGPDLVKNVPNLTFSKTNFTGYNIQIRGIGTQAISVTTDPAVAISFNDVPFLRNHFFEQEFFDVSQVEVLRGPQGTLYGRNATSGVVNILSAKPSDHWEAQASVDVGNFNNRRLEGMLNAPLLDDKLDLRVAGEWTKRDGYSFNEQTQHSTDGRNLWSGRVSLLVRPIQNLTATFVYEHFQENDDRVRSTKQLCQRDDGPAVVDGPAGPQGKGIGGEDAYIALALGCKQTSLYAPTAYQTPNAAAVPFIATLQGFTHYMDVDTDPYDGDLQSRDLRVTDSLVDPHYTAKSDTYQLNIDYAVTPELTLTSQTAYNQDHLYSTEDFNRYNTAPGIFNDIGGNTFVGQDGQFCDPQLGCSDRLVGQDISREHAHQVYQEVRLTSNMEGPLNFVAGANYLSYGTVEDYFVLANVITLSAMYFNSAPFFAGPDHSVPPLDAPHIPFDAAIANACGPIPAGPDALAKTKLGGLGCAYIDPNPLESIDGEGHNYFRSRNPYRLKSWAGFGEVYYEIAADVKLTGGLRFTDDRKSFDEYPSWTLIGGKGFYYAGTIDQEWKEVTGRLNLTWTPKLDFTDQSLFYGSYAHGYKGGGANPPSVTPITLGQTVVSSPGSQTHPLTFEPEYNDAFELGTKNTLLDGAMTLNGDVFFYKYRNYQISQIVDRTSVNLNFDATVRGVELESTWEPIPGLRFNFSGGYENATLNEGSKAIDLMDRTNGHAGWMTVKPYVTQTSNCVLPTYVVNELLYNNGLWFGCLYAYTPGLGSPGLLDPVTTAPYVANPDPVNYPGYIGFDPTTAPNNGEGFEKDLSGNQLPNAPHFTVSLGAQYSMPVSESWAGTLRGDFYYQSDSFARVFNDRPYDEIHGYTNLNFALIFTNQDGWQAMAYVKNVLDTTAITGAFLNSDDAALTTNVFVTDPRLFGIRITKNW
jgi:outer membrane receptor protein involved in Fe transport